MEGDFPSVLPTFLAVMSLTFLPFFVVMATSFTKIIIVLSLLRNALGIQQAPSAIVLNSIALTMTAFIMVPVGDQIMRAVQDQNLTLTDWDSARTMFSVLSGEFSTYLARFADPREISFFVDAAKAIWPPSLHEFAAKDNVFILLPAHVISEITRAFEIAFLLFLPFVIIDMVVSNILLAMGAMMVPPMLISLPIKLLLFVAADGWARLLHSLVLSYV